MKVMIDIPKEFEVDLRDKFNEFFERVKCDINSSLKSQEVSMCGNYERKPAEMFLSAFEKVTIIPDDATNKEKVLNIFPNTTTRIVDNKGFPYVEMEQNDEWIADFNVDWWNAPYKKGAEE